MLLRRGTERLSGKMPSQQTWEFMNTFAPWLFALGALAIALLTISFQNRRGKVMDADDTYLPDVAVAAVDILGVKKLVGKADKNILAMAALSLFVRNACSSGYYTRPDFSAKAGDLYQDDVYFGDCVYLFGDTGMPVSKQVNLLAAKLTALIFLGLISEPRILVRAAIATGDLRTKMVSTVRGIRDVRIGTAMVRAYLLEANQCWIGGAIDYRAPLSEDCRKRVVEYPIPLKSGSDLGHPVALNWMGGIGKRPDRDEVEANLRRAVAEVGTGDDEETKLTNTLEFVRCVFEAGRFSAFQMHQE